MATTTEPGALAMPLKNRWARGAARAAAMLLPLLSGCEPEGRVTLHPASGRVLVDGQPVPGVEVRLYPEEKLHDPDAPRPFATSGDDGAFRLGTFEGDDGAPAGRYRVTLVLPDGPTSRASVEDRLGGRYSDPARSPLRATIEEGGTALDPFEVEAKAAPARPKRPAARPSRPDPDGVS